MVGSPQQTSVPGGANVAGGPASQEPPNATAAEEITSPTTTILSPSNIADAAQASPTTAAPLDATEEYRISPVVTAIEAEKAGKEPSFVPSSEQQNNLSPENVDGVGEPSAIADAGGRCQSSAERNVWSVFNPIWNSSPVNKPRLPTAKDARVDWAATSGRPEELRLFLGMKNPVNRGTVSYLRRCIEEKLVVSGIVLRGPAGCGKSAVVKAFLSEFLEGFTSTPEAFTRLHRTRVLKITPEELTTSPNKLAARVRKFCSTKKDRLADIVPKFFMVDGMERVPSKSQQVLWSLFEAAVIGAVSSSEGGGSGGGGAREAGTAAGMRMILTTRDASKLVTSIRKSVKPLKLELVEEIDGVRIFLRILQAESVGYELLGVKEIFRRYWPDLGRCIKVAQKVFCEKQYLSEVNMLKIIGPRKLVERNEKMHHVQASASLEPLENCRACTVHPPCRHISEQDLAARGLQRRAELPQRRDEDARGTVSGDSGDGVGFLDCQAFLKNGACRVFNDTGRCNYHHPLGVHTVEIPRPRCPQCTIRLPCGHCDYDQAKRRLQAFCDVAGSRIKKRVTRLHHLLLDSGDNQPTQAKRDSKTTATIIKATASSRRANSSDASVSGGGSIERSSSDAVTPSAVGYSSTNGNRGELPTTTATATAAAMAEKSRTLRTPPMAHEAPLASNQSIGTIAANTPLDGTVKSVAIVDTSHHKSSSSSSNSSLLLVRKAISKLETLSVAIKDTHAWTDDRGQGGGAREFRAPVFDKKLEVLFHRCEDAHTEADAVTEAFCAESIHHVTRQGTTTVV